jgi:uncharacterized protein YbjT (DUF2867 family)
MTITVLGATGHTGRVAVERLVAGGHRVRAVARSADKLGSLGGAEAVAADASDAAALARAFRGSDAVYALVPPDMRAADFPAYQARLTDALVAAVKESGVKKVVFLSSVGAEQPSGTGPIAGLHRAEQKLGDLPGLELVVLRPGFFFENHYATLGLIKAQGINGGHIAPDVPIAQIATRDIGVAAAEALARPARGTGVEVQELLGPRDLTMAEATRIIGAAIGKPDLAYVQFPADGYRGALEQAGLSPSIAGLYTEMAQAMNAGKIRSVAGRSAATSTPTEFSSFVAELGAAYRAQA